jgi:hypothetical protein
MALKEVGCLMVGDLVCEADGFIWRVTRIQRGANSRTASSVLTLVPEFETMTARGPLVRRLRNGSQVRVLD